jgi:hypothetical protein
MHQVSHNNPQAGFSHAALRHTPDAAHQQRYWRPATNPAWRRQTNGTGAQRLPGQHHQNCPPARLPSAHRRWRRWNCHKRRKRPGWNTRKNGKWPVHRPCPSSALDHAQTPPTPPSARPCAAGNCGTSSCADCCPHRSPRNARRHINSRLSAPFSPLPLLVCTIAYPASWHVPGTILP